MTKTTTKTENKPKMEQPRDKRGKYTKLSGQEKRVVVQKAAELDAEGMSMSKIALKLKVPRVTLLQFLKSSTHYDNFLKKKHSVLKIKMIESIEKDLRAQAKKRKSATFAALGLSAAIKLDKVWPILPGKVADITIGDNRRIIVRYPNFKPPEEGEARQATTTTPIPEQETPVKHPLKAPQPKVKPKKARTIQTATPERSWGGFEEKRKREL